MRDFPLANGLRRRELIRKRPHPNQAYWFVPEYRNPKELLRLAQIDLYRLYQLYSGPAHGSFAGRCLLNDYSHTEHDMNPRKHPVSRREAIWVSSRLLLEIAHALDRWESVGGEPEANILLERLTKSIPKPEDISADRRQGP